MLIPDADADVGHSWGEGERRERSIVEYDDDDNDDDDIGDDNDDNDDDYVGVGPREGEREGQGRAWNIRAATSSTALVDSAAKEFVKNISHYDRCAKIGHQTVFKLLSKKLWIAGLILQWIVYTGKIKVKILRKKFTNLQKCARAE